VKQTGLNHRVFAIGEGFANVEGGTGQETEKAFRAKYGVSNLYPRAFNEMRMLARAINKANSTDVIKIGFALEDMKFEVLNGGDGLMRKDDHQFFQPMYIVSLGERGPKEPFDEENTGWGWRTAAKIDTKDTMLPTACKMARPN
jgi:branched-chain amino acid transport system substrate-binding protein